MPSVEAENLKTTLDDLSLLIYCFENQKQNEKNT